MLPSSFPAPEPVLCDGCGDVTVALAAETLEAAKAEIEAKGWGLTPWRSAAGTEGSYVWCWHCKSGAR